MKFIRCFETKMSQKEFMELIANTVYEQRALIKGQEDQLFLLWKMMEYEESEADRVGFSQRHHIECYILTILSRLCEANVQNFHQLSQIMEEKGYPQERFEKLVGKLVENIRPVIVESDKQVQVGILMLLSVIVRSEKKN